MKAKSLHVRKKHDVLQYKHMDTFTTSQCARNPLHLQPLKTTTALSTLNLHIIFRIYMGFEPNGVSYISTTSPLGKAKTNGHCDL